MDVMGLAFSPDGKLLASAGQDQSIRLWNVITGEQVKLLGEPIWGHFLDDETGFLSGGTCLVFALLISVTIIWINWWFRRRQKVS